MKMVAPFKATHFGSAPQTNTLLASALFTSVLVLAVWANNFAIFNSELLNNRLGTRW